MRRILDLGCGTGDSWSRIGVDVRNCQIIGIDLDRQRARTAALKHSDRGWQYLCARGEDIPLPDGSVDGIFCNVALPYMRIPRALSELHRVLTPGGWLKATLHTPSFGWSELRRSFPKPKQTLYRAFVLFNGAVFHFSGNVISLGKVSESCQTDAGMRIALRRAGFVDVAIRHQNQRFFVEAQREQTSFATDRPELVHAS